MDAIFGSNFRRDTPIRSLVDLIGSQKHMFDQMWTTGS